MIAREIGDDQVKKHVIATSFGLAMTEVTLGYFFCLGWESIEPDREGKGILAL